MTDRHAGYVVVLDADIREDDAEAVLAALRMVKHVRSVAPVVANPGLMIAEIRARTDYADRLVAAIREVLSGTSTSPSAACAEIDAGTAKR